MRRGEVVNESESRKMLEEAIKTALSIRRDTYELTSNVMSKSSDLLALLEATGLYSYDILTPLKSEYTNIQLLRKHPTDTTFNFPNVYNFGEGITVEMFGQCIGSVTDDQEIKFRYETILKIVDETIPNYGRIFPIYKVKQ